MYHNAYKKLAVLVIGIFMVISFNNIAVAGNSKTEAGSGVNPAGQSNKNGFDNGNAWWKAQQEIEELKALLAEKQLEIEYLEEDVTALEELLDNQSCPEPAPMMQAMAAPEQTWEAEARKFAIYKMGYDHPNTPEAYGVLTNFFVPASEMQNLITTMDSGSYQVNVRVEDDFGNVVNIETELEAELKDRNYYDHFIQIQ